MDEHGFRGSYLSVQRYLRTARPKGPRGESEKLDAHSESQVHYEKGLMWAELFEVDRQHLLPLPKALRRVQVGIVHNRRLQKGDTWREISLPGVPRPCQRRAHRRHQPFPRRPLEVLARSLVPQYQLILHAELQ